MMNTLILLGAAGAAAYALLRPSGTPSSEAPKDANDLLAVGLAPSLADPVELGRLANMFVAGAANQTDARRQLRLMLYGLAMMLKRAMLLKGALPNALELLAIAYAPTESFSTVNQAKAGLLQDALRAVTDGLADDMTSAQALATYIAAISQVAGSNAQLTTEQRKRLVAYALALQAKRIMLMNGANFGRAVYLAVAMMPTSGAFGKYLAAKTEPGSTILRYV